MSIRPVRTVSRCVFSAVVLTGVLAGVPAQAEPQEFSFKDPKGVNGVVFVMESRLEPIVGMIGGVGGQVIYDPEKPEELRGEVTIDLGQLSLINPAMTKVLRGGDWLDISERFVVSMNFTGVESADAGEEGVAALQANAMLHFGEQQAQLTLPVEATYLEDAAEQRGAGKGDLLVLRSMFKLDRIEHLGIKPDQPTDKVGQEIMVMVPIVGYSK